MSAFSKSATKSATNVSKSTSPIILDVNGWDANATKCMQPKLNKSGGKQISIISTQTNRMLSVVTPSMMTWGIADFTDEKGVSDGKFQMSINFPLDKDANDATNQFLEKMKGFEEHVKDVATENSTLWWGQKMSRDILNYSFFPSLKYPKDKETKQTDYTRPPSMRVKVPCYEGKWAVEIYDTASNLLFPCEDEEMSPMDFVPKQSQVISVIQCSGIWIGGKGWGLTWKLVQCVVKPFEVVSIYGKCHIQLDGQQQQQQQPQVKNIEYDEEDETETQNIKMEQPKKSTLVSKEQSQSQSQTQPSTYVDDSDEEESVCPPPPALKRSNSAGEYANETKDELLEELDNSSATAIQEVEAEPEQEAEPEAEPVPVETKVKKVVKKESGIPVPSRTVSVVSDTATSAIPKKKIVKKAAV
jgi:hypothetical protein